VDLDAYVHRRRLAGIQYRIGGKLSQHPAEAPLRDGPLLDLDVYRKAHGQDWLAYRVGGSIRVHCGNPAGLTAADLQSCAEKTLQGYARVCDFTSSHTGKSCSFRLEPHVAGEKFLVQFLESHLGRALLSALDASGPAAS
jgi:hypothetical protein